MGIEPIRAVLTSVQNKRCGAIADSKCDWRVNFRGMWGHVRLRRHTSMCEIPGPSFQSWSPIGSRPDIAADKADIEIKSRRLPLRQPRRPELGASMIISTRFF